MDAIISGALSHPPATIAILRAICAQCEHWSTVSESCQIGCSRAPTKRWYTTSRCRSGKWPPLPLPTNPTA